MPVMQLSPNSTESDPPPPLDMPCLARFALVRLAPTSAVAYTSLGISSIVLATLTIVANCLMLHALSKCQSLYSPTKASFCSLAMSDLGVGFLVQPLFAVYCFAVNSNNIDLFCTIQGPYAVVAYSLGTVSFLTITILALDRFYAFKLRVRYRQVVTYKRAVLKLVACWIFGILWPFTWLLIEKIAMFTAIVTIFCCAVTTSGSSIATYFAIRSRQRQNQQNRSNQLTIGRYKKLLDTVVLTFCLLLACYVPYFIAVGVSQATELDSNTILAFNITSEILYLNSLLNPILYCWRMREIRREFLIVLPCFESQTYQIRPAPTTGNHNIILHVKPRVTRPSDGKTLETTV